MEKTKPRGIVEPDEMSRLVKMVEELLKDRGNVANSIDWESLERLRMTAVERSFTSRECDIICSLHESMIIKKKINGE